MSIKIAPNPSKILTDYEWRNYVLYHRESETLAEYENNIQQHRDACAAISEYYKRELQENTLLCDRVWRHN